jgi:Flp pilus assembly protein TadG
MLFPLRPKHLITWCRNTKAAVIVEFALFGVLMILALLLLFEIGYCYAMDADLNRQLAKVVRQARTGQFNDASDQLAQQAFKQELCKAKMIASTSCINNITLQRQVLQAGTNPDTLRRGSCENDNLKNSYANVQSGNVVAYTACYPWKYITPLSLLLNAFSDGGSAGNTYYAHATIAWRKE